MKPDTFSHGGDTPAPNSPSSQSSAADLVRHQIDSLYDTTAANTPVDTPAAAAQHSAHTPHVQADQWQAYHSAWQEYYQKYYQLYYEHHTKKSAHAAFGSQPEPEAQVTDEPLSKDTALAQLREQLRKKVRESTHKARKSRHFVPILAATSAVLLLGFIQFNSLIIASVSAYVSPGALSPQNIVVNPQGDTSVSADPRLVIPKINVDVPVIYGIGADNASQMAAMEKGVAHFAIPGASSVPGEIGNTVLSGHSSNDLFDTGDYKFIFAQLDKLKAGDTLYAHYEGVRYTYVVTKTEVVKPTEVNKLIYDTDKPVLTLITCTPLGTALNRLLVTAEQTSPDPAKASPAPEGTASATDSESIPGSAPTLLEKLFGAR